jgi:adenosine deaminase
VRDLSRLPKAHLHIHLDGALREQTLRVLCARQGVSPPAIPSKSGYSSFGQFQEVIRASHTILAVPENLASILDEIIEDAVSDGAVWIELSVWPGLFEGRLGSDTAALTAVLNAGHAAAKRHGTGFGLMIAANCHHGPEAAASTAELAASLAADGAVSFGLDGDESSLPPDAFADAFDVATEAGLLSTPHAGELLGPESVVAAIDLLHADRVLHGVRAIEDAALVERLANTAICLDICPTSNARLGVFDSEHHPLGSLIEAGVTCSVNADDPLLFGVGLLDEYEHCRTQFLLSDEALAKIAENSVQASGAPVAIKTAALEGIVRWLASGETEPGSP